MDLHERELDSLIQQALQQPVTALQKQRAWAQLQLKLAEQAALPVVAADEPLISRIWRSWLHSLRAFALEETRYEAARQGRYAFSYYSFAACPPRFAMDLLGPLRVSTMSPVC